MSSPPSPPTGHVVTLHRYFIWSSVLKSHFDETLAGFAARGEACSLTSDEGIKAYAYMSYWYAALYVVVEGWQRLGLHDELIDELLDSPNVELLKLYRHGVFHFHEDYFNRRLTLPLIDRGDAPVAWVGDLSTQLGRWFLSWFDEYHNATADDPATR